MVLIIYILGCIVSYVLHCVYFIHCTENEMNSVLWLLLGSIVITLLSWVGAIIMLLDVIKVLKNS